MLERFVMPDLERRIRRTNHAFYHLDGEGAISHLDMLLSLENLRDTKARTQQSLEETIAHALATLTPQDARAWFNASGYPTCQN